MEVLESISEARGNRWCEMIENIDMRHSSRKTWGMIKNLGNDSINKPAQTKVTPDQVATQLLINGKTPRMKPKTQKRKLMRDATGENDEISKPFGVEDLDNAIAAMKDHKAAGLDDICTEQLRYFGPKAKIWMTDLYNYINDTKNIKNLEKSQDSCFIKTWERGVLPKKLSASIPAMSHI